MPSVRRFGVRVVFGLGAFFLADLIVGLAAFSVITLAVLWYFSLGWIHLVQLFELRGLTFGTPLQLGFAAFGVCVTLPLLAVTILLAIRAAALPKWVYHLGKP